MPIDPATGFALTLDGRVAERLAVVERRLALLERDGPRLVTALPTQPFDGQEVRYVDLTNGVVWRLRYRATNPDGTPNANANKWDFLGGPPLIADAAGSVNTASGTNVDLAGGPTITVPLRGEYRAVFGIRASNNTAGFFATAELVVAGAATGSLAYSLAAVAGNTTYPGTVANVTIAAANDVVKLMYRTGGGGTATFDARHISLAPIRLT